MNEPELKTKEGEVGQTNPTNPTKNDTPEKTEAERIEWERTTTNKKLFLEYFPKNSLHITNTCLKINIDRSTYYDWMDTDPDFNEAVEKSRRNMRNEVEDVLVGLALIKKDPPSVRYWLDRNHPGYTPRSKVENFVGTISLDELLSEEDAEVEQEQKEWDKEHGTENNTKQNTTGAETKAISEASKEIKPGADREAPIDSKQEGATGAVQIQQGPELLLEKKDETKPNSESTPKGNLESDRRRPAPRLRT
jgi:hypothetical protein